MEKKLKPIGPCRKCGCSNKNKFYWSNKSLCIECVKKKVHRHRIKNIDYVREYDRQRGELPHRREAVKTRYKEVMKDPNRKKNEWAVKRRRLEKNQIKRAAHIITDNAIRDGRLIRKGCEVCGKRKVEAHHDDYTEPMKVRWLCRKHHTEHHKAERERLRNK